MGQLRHVEGGVPKSRVTPFIQPSVLPRSTKTCVQAAIRPICEWFCVLRGVMETVHDGN